jgi:hypothetical protein
MIVSQVGQAGQPPCVKRTSKQQVTLEPITLQAALPSNHGRRVYYRSAYLAQAVLNQVDSSRHVPRLGETYQPPFKPFLRLGEP